MNSSKVQHRRFELGDDAFRVGIAVDSADHFETFGPRFDRSGYVHSMDVGGHELLQSNGLVDEFGLDGIGVLGYENAKPGQPFLKIGVGQLIRTDNQAYSFRERYPVRQLAETEAVLMNNRVEVTQHHRPDNCGYGYLLRKVFEIDTSQRVLSIRYRLKNLSRSTFSFNQYNHNWLLFNGLPISSGYQIDLKFLAKLDPLPSCLIVNQNTIALIRQPPEGGFCTFHRAKIAADATDVVVSHSDSAIGMTISGNFDIPYFKLWGDSRAICPEMFFEGRLLPDQSIEWVRQYASVFTDLKN